MITLSVSLALMTVAAFVLLIRLGVVAREREWLRVRRLELVAVNQEEEKLRCTWMGRAKSCEQECTRLQNSLTQHQDAAVNYRKRLRKLEGRERELEFRVELLEVKRQELGQALELREEQIRTMSECLQETLLEIKEEDDEE